MKHREQNRTENTIPAKFSSAARACRRHTLFHYFTDRWETVTYESFSDAVSATASYLLRSGLLKGDRVAIIAENSPWWCAAYLSILTAGGVAVPMDSQLSPPEIKNLLYDSGAKIAFHSTMTQAAVKASAEKLAALRHTVHLLSVDSAEFRDLSSGAVSAGHPELFPGTSAGELASVIYTSGTTGRPKGVMLTHQNFCSDADALISAGIVTQEDTVLSVLPLHHTYAFMCTFLVPVFLGGSIVYPASLKGPDLLSAIRERGVTVLIGVPQLLGLLRNGIMEKIRAMPGPMPFLLLKLHGVSGFCREKCNINIGRFLFRSVHKAFGERFRFFASGGAKLDPVIMRDLEALGFTVLEGYGLTETAPVLTFNPLSRRKAGSAGKPLPSVSLRILDPSPTGEGEIEVRGPMVMQGYYRNESATAEVLRDSWFRTGDRGRVDSEGYLFITGRSKEVIVLSSGKNIYPEDVEKIYGESPLIKELCVLGIGSQGITTSLHALIVPDFEYARLAGITNIMEAVKWEINALSAKMPSYMRVTGFSLSREPLPRTPLGKLKRFMIKSEGDRNSREHLAENKDVPVANETSQTIVQALRQFTPAGQKISTGANLELDLGLDSLAKIELTASLEKTFSLKLPENFLADVQTVGELAEKIRIQTAGGFRPEGIGKTSWANILAADPSEKIRFTESKKVFSVFLMHTLLKCVFRLFFRLEVRGLKNIPADRNYILTPNHTSYLDGFVLLLAIPFAYFKNMYALGLSDFFAGPLKGWFAQIAHVIPIDAASYLNKALQAAAYVLRNGYSLSVFPEGGRSLDGHLMEFKKGVGILALETGVPVVPVFIRGAIDALPRTAILPRPAKITVTFGTPLVASHIDFSKKPSDIDNYQYFANALRERVEALR
jgi:long-chain acyl-CoA synthetase